MENSSKSIETSKEAEDYTASTTSKRTSFSGAKGVGSSHIVETRKVVHIKDTIRGLSSSSTIPYATSRRFSECHKLEDQMNLQHLVELMDVFNNADKNRLTIDEFKTAVSRILGKRKDDPQMEIMFMKIDSDCDGVLDWDEFCTYMLLEYQEKDSMKEEQIPPFPYPLKLLSSPHKNCLSRITALTNVARGGRSGEDPGKEGNIVSVSRDGLICFWKSNLTLNKTIQLDYRRSKLIWVTDMVVMPNVHKMLLSFTNCAFAIHDLLTPGFQEVFHVKSLPHSIVALDYWYDDCDYDHSVLSFGDIGGGVCIMEFTNATRSLFGHPISTKSDCVKLVFPKLHHQKLENTSTAYFPKIHADWVNKVKFCPLVEGVLSCACDSESSLVVTNINYLRVSNVFRVWKGLNTFDYSKEWNLIATGGRDTDLRLWNPYVSTKPTALLKGHSSPIIHVAIINQDGYILSFSKDMELKVWSIQDHICFQTCNKFQEMDVCIPCLFYFHPPTANVVVGSTQIGALELFREENQKKEDLVSHDKPLCGALYNKSFNQVVSACHGSVVMVWELETGEKTMQFSKCHDDLEITAMSFDPTGRRLITGARDGSIKLWNFNNGACLLSLKNKCNTEVTSFCFLKHKIFASGWSKIISEYTDLREAEDIVPKYWGEGVHKEDILCMAELEPDIIATASYDGDIVLWDVEIQQPLAVLNNQDRSKNGQMFNKLHRKLSTLKKKMRDTEESGSTFGSRSKSESSDASPTPSCFSSSSSQQRSDASVANSKSKFGYKSNTAVECLIFLPNRLQDNSTANLIVAGASGIVQFWNIFGGGLIGEFSVFDNRIRSVACVKEEELKSLHGVTACKLHSNSQLLITGTSMGFIQEWDISDYCIDVPCESRPVNERPVMFSAWKGHFSSVVSIDMAEDKDLIITASTDRCVSLWAIGGRYIGTFGEKQPWKITSINNLPRKIPPGLHQAASFNTMQTVGGPCESKWKLAKHLFQQLKKNKRFKNVNEAFSGSSSEYTYDESYVDNILGETYKRTTPYRQPMKPLTIRSCDHQVSVYSTLKCSDIHEPDMDWPTAVDNLPDSSGNSSDKQCEPSISLKETSKINPRSPFTEKTLLPKLC